MFNNIRIVEWSSASGIPWKLLEGSTEQVMEFVQNSFEVLDELKHEVQPPNVGHGDEFASSGTDDRKSQLRDTEYSIRQFVAEIHGFQEFSTDVEAQLASKPCLLLSGAAGMGKTHLLCDVAKHRIDAGMPTILLMG